MTNFQREGASSNADVGEKFRADVHDYFQSKAGVDLKTNFSVDINESRSRKFSLGSDDPPILIICRAHTWTKSGNIPSAKLTSWGGDMNYFRMAPKKYRKIFVAVRNVRKTSGESLLEYFIRLRDDLIPDGVELWEFDTTSKIAKILKS